MEKDTQVEKVEKSDSVLEEKVDVTAEISEEEKERIERERLQQMRITKALERQAVIASWASQRANFIAIILLIFFLLLIIVSVVLRPSTPLPSQPVNNEEIKKQEEQKNAR